MVQWEYMKWTDDGDMRSDASEVLNKLGMAGWEAYSVTQRKSTYRTYFFKRQIE